MIRSIFTAALVLLSALPMSADGGKKRAVQKPPQGVPVSPPQAEATLIGTVVDAMTGTPVINADVSATTIDRFTRTDGAGTFTMRVPPDRAISLTISRSGYQTFTTTVTVPSGTTSQRFQLISNPTVQIRTTSGVTYEVDVETVEFGYIVPFAGFTKDRKITMCKPDGSAFSPDRNDIKRIQGPSTQASNSCCTSGPISGVTLELKNGERTQAFFTDSCFGYSMLVLGLDHTKAQLVDVKFTDVAEVVFP